MSGHGPALLAGKILQENDLLRAAGSSSSAVETPSLTQAQAKLLFFGPSRRMSR